MFLYLKVYFMIIGISTISNFSFQINDVLLFKGLKHNLLSMSQLCDKGIKISFYSFYGEIIDANTNVIALICYRHSNVYIINFHDIAFRDLYLMSIKEEDVVMT